MCGRCPRDDLTGLACCRGGRSRCRMSQCRRRCCPGRVRTELTESAELEVRIHSPPAVSLQTIGSAGRRARVRELIHRIDDPAPNRRAGQHHQPSRARRQSARLRLGTVPLSDQLIGSFLIYRSHFGDPVVQSLGGHSRPPGTHRRGDPPANRRSRGIWSRRWLERFGSVRFPRQRNPRRPIGGGRGPRQLLLNLPRMSSSRGRPVLSA